MLINLCNNTLSSVTTIFYQGTTTPSCTEIQNLQTVCSQTLCFYHEHCVIILHFYLKANAPDLYAPFNGSPSMFLSHSILMSTCSVSSAIYIALRYVIMIPFYVRFISSASSWLLYVILDDKAIERTAVLFLTKGH